MRLSEDSHSEFAASSTTRLLKYHCLSVGEEYAKTSFPVRGFGISDGETSLHTHGTLILKVSVCLRERPAF